MVEKSSIRVGDRRATVRGTASATKPNNNNNDDKKKEAH